MANREKDREFAVALLDAGLVPAMALRARISDLPDTVSPDQRRRMAELIDRHG